MIEDTEPMNSISCCEYISFSEESTMQIGELLAEYSFPGLVFLLEGDLGTGKTTLVRGFCRAESCNSVRSPSFTLVNRYFCGEKTVVHSDLYRLSTVDPTEIDLESYMDEQSVLFVEWADRGVPGDFSEIWTIRFRYEDKAEDEGRRILSFSAHGPRAEKTLESFLGKLKERKKIQ